MLNYLWNRINRDEQGFTLVELLVVIVILGVLMGIGIPAYNGFIKRGHEAATKSELQAVSTALKYLEVEGKINEDEKITKDIGELVGYLGDDLIKAEGDGNKWTFLEKYTLEVSGDYIEATTEEDDRLDAQVTKTGVFIEGDEGYVVKDTQNEKQG